LISHHKRSEKLDEALNAGQNVLIDSRRLKDAHVVEIGELELEVIIVAIDRHDHRGGDESASASLRHEALQPSEELKAARQPVRTRSTVRACEKPPKEAEGVIPVLLHTFILLKSGVPKPVFEDEPCNAEA